jgi:hypothetical protein
VRLNRAVLVFLGIAAPSNTHSRTLGRGAAP